MAQLTILREVYMIQKQFYEYIPNGKCQILFLMTLTVYTLLLPISEALSQTHSNDDWSVIQNEVWETVEAYSHVSHKRDLEKYLRFWHPNFLGWYNGDSKPTNHDQRSKGLRNFFNATTSLEYKLEPRAIQIVASGKAAIVHYELKNILQVNESGKKEPGLSYWTDYLVKENGKWLLISDHGGSVQEEEKVNIKRNNNGIDYLEIPVTDMNETKRFYGDVFGWKFVDYGPDYVSFNDGRFDGGFRKELSVQRGGPLIVFYSTQLESLQVKIKDAGGIIVKEIFDFPGGKRFHFTDPSGNELAVWSDK